MQKLIIILFFLGISFGINAQCPESISNVEMQKGMFIFCVEKNFDNTKYVAEILSVNGKDFSCRFLHSNSLYQFTDVRKEKNESNAKIFATVKSNTGGAYKAGSVFIMNVYMADPDPCDLDSEPNRAFYVIATFAIDKKSYIGRCQANSNGYTIRFGHSKSVYTFDKSFKVLTVKGGGYAVGNKVKVVHARNLEF